MNVNFEIVIYCVAVFDVCSNEFLVAFLSKGLFGTTTMDDVNILATHINSQNDKNNWTKCSRFTTTWFSFVIINGYRELASAWILWYKKFQIILTQFFSISKTFFIGLQHLKITLAITLKFWQNKLVFQINLGQLLILFFFF